MFHLNPALEKLEQRIAPGAVHIPGCGAGSHSRSHGSKGSKSHKSSKGSKSGSKCA